nr:AGE family epimerase/isomerase [Novosphingobium sp. FKTRR1]
MWSSAGFDRQSNSGRGSFVERLGLDGAPQHEVPRRVMVQARQVHVYATAARNGWFGDGAELALRAGETMIAHYAVDDGKQGWAFSCTAQGVVIDLRRDLYAHAFVLLALADLIRLDPNPRYVALVCNTLAFLEREMAHPAGGFLEQWPVPVLPRRQNPHMHLLEAFLALHECGAVGDFARQIEAMIALFDRWFMASPDAVLPEFFDDHWTPVDGGRTFEPGHHFEWVWLLTRCTVVCGIPAGDRIDRLMRQALRGVDAQGGVVDQVGPAGPLARTYRLWPAMEAAKAFAIPTGHAARPNGVGEVLGSARHRFLAPAVPGGWIDRTDRHGLSLVDHMPASSLYHICTALDFLR